jgi:hypothetical protein
MFTAHSTVKNLTLKLKVDTNFFWTDFVLHIFSDDLRDPINKCVQKSVTEHFLSSN